MKIVARGILLILLVIFLLPVTSVLAAPNPHLFTGDVSIDGNPAPDGTDVTAEASFGSFSVATSGGSYTLVVNGDTDDIGTTITFYVDGIFADTENFAFLGDTSLDLSVTTPTPPPPAVDQVNLTILVSGSGTTSPSPGTRNYDIESNVNITAIPAEGWLFSNWTGLVLDTDSASTIVVMDGNKTITANFVEEEDITAPVISNVTVTNITKTNANISWTTNEPATSQVNYAADSNELTPLDVTLVTQHQISLADLTPGTTYTYKVLSRDASGNAAESPESTFTTEGLPATFVLSDWDIAFSEAGDERQATIDFLLSNIGNLPGSYDVAMVVNDTVEDSKVIELEAGGSQTISFSTTKPGPGAFTVEVNGVSFFFTVPAPSEPIEAGSAIDWPLVGSIAGGVVLLVILTLFIISRTHYIALFIRK
jgi:hypothetical protein